MRPGFFPSQQRAIRKALEKADKFDHFRRRTRRSFLALVGLAIGTGAGGFWLGTKGTDAATLADSSSLSHLHDLAMGTLDNLERRAVHLIDGLVAAPDDERLAYGVLRLIVLAGTKPDDNVLRVRLRQLARNTTLPQHLRGPLAALEQLRGR